MKQFLHLDSFNEIISWQKIKQLFANSKEKMDNSNHNHFWKIGRDFEDHCALNHNKKKMNEVHFQFSLNKGTKPISPSPKKILWKEKTRNKLKQGWMNWFIWILIFFTWDYWFQQLSWKFFFSGVFCCTSLLVCFLLFCFPSPFISFFDLFSFSFLFWKSLNEQLIEFTYFINRCFGWKWTSNFSELV